MSPLFLLIVLLTLLLAVAIVLLARLGSSLRRARRELHQRSTELAHAGRLAAAGQLSAAIAHEINQPLGAILSNADAAEILLQRAEPPLAELRHILADIRADDLRAHEVIRRLRSLLERRELVLAEIDLRGALIDVAHVLAAEAHRRQIDLQVVPGQVPLRLRGDAVQLEQVVLNLALNAMDAVAAQPPGSRRVSVTAQPAGDWIEVAVADTGTGLSEQVAQRMFEAFYTTKPGGLGLGLSIAKTIVDAHRGRLRAKPRAAGGTLVSLQLPRMAQAATVPEADSLARSRPGAIHHA